MELQADAADATSGGDQAFDQTAVFPAVTVPRMGGLVDVQAGVGGKVFFGPFEGSFLVARLHLQAAGAAFVMRDGLVDNVPTLDARAVASGDFPDPFFPQWRGLVGIDRHPVGHGPFAEVPYKRVAVDAQSALFAELHDAVRRRTAGDGHAVPGESGAVLLGFERAPVEGGGGAVEERAEGVRVVEVELFVGVVAELENIGAEMKRRIVLLGANFHAGERLASVVGHADHGVALAVEADAFFDARLDRGIGPELFVGG